MHGPTLIQAIILCLALFVLPGLIVALITIRTIRHIRTQKDGAEGGGDLPYGDVIHVPVGATPRTLVDPCHGEVI